MTLEPDRIFHALEAPWSLYLGRAFKYAGLNPGCRRVRLSTRPVGIRMVAPRSLVVSRTLMVS